MGEDEMWQAFEDMDVIVVDMEMLKLGSGSSSDVLPSLYPDAVRGDIRDLDGLSYMCISDANNWIPIIDDWFSFRFF